MEPEVAKFIKQICATDKIPVPKIGYINDDNPQSFTYGSLPRNARIIFTNGIIKYLNTDEKKSVFGHEVGHVVHRDFIVMTLASFMLTMLYVIGRSFIRAARGARKGAPAAIAIGIFSLVFYYIGTYFLLYLSRAREYYADEYSKQKMGTGNPLSTALVKIAYGILTSTSQNAAKTNELMQGTRALGIYDHKHAKSFGLAGADYVVDKDDSAITGSIVYDTHSIWAFLFEFGSSHPLTGKRIIHMLDGEKKQVFDIGKVKSFPFDKGKCRKEFAVDLTVSKLWLILPIAIFLAGYNLPAAPIFGALLPALGVGLLILALYKYPGGGFTKTNVQSLMSQVYASPVRGIRAALDGKIVGKGVPGFVLSESMMFQDKTGLLYFGFTAGLPLIGDLYFAIKKVKTMIGNAASCNGWFFRGFNQSLSLYTLQSGSNTFHSREKGLSIIGALIILILGTLILAPSVLSLHAGSSTTANVLHSWYIGLNSSIAAAQTANLNLQIYPQTVYQGGNIYVSCYGTGQGNYRPAGICALDRPLGTHLCTQIGSCGVKIEDAPGTYTFYVNDTTAYVYKAYLITVLPAPATTSIGSPASSSTSGSTTGSTPTASTTPITSQTSQQIDGYSYSQAISVNSTSTALTTSKPNDVVIVYLAEGGSSLSAFGISDSAGLSWRPIKSFENSNGRAAEYWMAISPTPLKNDIITTTSLSPGNLNLYAIGINGADLASPTDANSTSVPTAPAANISGMITTSNPKDLILAWLFVASSPAMGAPTGLPFSTLPVNSGGPSTEVAYATVTSTQTNLNVSWGWNPVEYIGGMSLIAIRLS